MFDCVLTLVGNHIEFSLQNGALYIMFSFIFSDVNSSNLDVSFRKRRLKQMRKGAMREQREEGRCPWRRCIPSC